MTRSLVLAVAALSCSPMPTKVPLSAPGNSCASAIELSWPPSGPLVIETDAATGFADHVQCGASTGPDVLYRLTLPQAGALVASSTAGLLTATGADCTFTCGGSPLTRQPWVATPRFIKRVDGGGEVGLIVEPGGGTSTTLELLPLTPGDRCEEAIEVELDGGVWQFSADVRLAFSERSPRDPGDVFFHVPVSTRGVLQVRSETPVHFRAACDGADGVYAASAEVEVEAGDQWLSIWEDGAPDTEAHPRTLSVALAPLLPGDACDQPLSLTFSDDGGVSTARSMGDLDGFGERLSSACMSATPDVFLSFHLDQPRTLSARLTTATTGALPTLELRTTCAFMSPAAPCATAALPGAGATLNATSLPVGDYVLRIGRAGAWTLDVSLTP